MDLCLKETSLPIRCTLIDEFFLESRCDTPQGFVDFLMEFTKVMRVIFGLSSEEGTVGLSPQ